MLGTPMEKERRGGRRSPQDRTPFGTPSLVTRHSVEVHIEELVLHGFGAGDRYRIARAVEKELARLLASQGLPGRVGAIEVDRLAGGTFSVKPGSRAEAIGTQIGQSVHGSMSSAAPKVG